jgi:hypothetical protein
MDLMSFKDPVQKSVQGLHRFHIIYFHTKEPPAPEATTYRSSQWQL